MDEEAKKLLVENNAMLKKLVFFQKLNQVYRAIYWTIIILSAVGAFYLLKPMLGSLVGLYTGGVGTSSLNGFNDISKNLDKSKIQDLVKSLNEN